MIGGGINEALINAFGQNEPLVTAAWAIVTIQFLAVPGCGFPIIPHS